MAKKIKYGVRLSSYGIGLLSSKLKKQLKDKYGDIKFNVRKFFNACSYTGINVRFDESVLDNNILDEIYLFLRKFAEKNAPILIIINGNKMFDSNYPSIFVRWRLTSIYDVAMYVENIDDKIKIIESDRSIDGSDGVFNKIKLKRNQNPSCSWEDCFEKPYD